MHTHHVKDSLKGKVALVTGAGSGIGRSAAKYLAYAGAKIMAVDLNLGDAQNTVTEILSNDEEGAVTEADASDSVSMRKVIEDIERRWGRLDVLFANAGINGVWAPIEELTEEAWDQTLKVNLRGTFVTVKYATPLLKKQGGSIIITSSINGTRTFSNTGATAYASSKAAQLAFGKMMALELARHKIRVNVICPGWVESKIHDKTTRLDLEEIKQKVDYKDGVVPLNHGGPGTPGEVAELVWFLASDLSGHISGTEVYIDGAQSLLQG